ncbi:probable RNA-binding protein ARP1 isoform X2 [Tripterygium wilfordii]|uniref:probable RNA-binding protein ARP1 isoform X2 n=1 Tax=Tripterygium wilfordii TaxID=458696 RepID=UPI0018F80ACE|nr:probable RNA-binding protein ARP1 isoform X2 [Tripterygium wilfordii]
MTMSSSNGNNYMGQFGDTTLTKVFVGGLAWETPKEALREHFEKYGHILEAVIISDKLTGRSKGYGFVTFNDAEAAKKACEDPAPNINGRRANCNLASLGARRPRSASTTPQQEGSNGGPRSASPAPANQVHWYYPAGTPASPFYHHQHQHHHALPFYGYCPAYIATDHMSYNHKVGYTGGSYVNGHFSQVYPGHPIVGANTLMPMYPLYHYHQSQTMGLPAHIFPQSTAGHIATVPTIMSKPPSIARNTVCLAVE